MGERAAWRRRSRKVVIGRTDRVLKNECHLVRGQVEALQLGAGNEAGISSM